MTSLPKVAVYGTSADEVDAVARIIDGEVGWETKRVCWPAAAARPPADREPGPVNVLVGAGHAALHAELCARAAGARLVAVGSAPPPEELAADGWLRVWRTPRVLYSLLVTLADAPAAAARTWRRKSDMIIGRSDQITELMRLLDRFAPSAAPVLVTGESGTGKELAAQALHYTGARARRPFVAINCAAIPDALFESELFGYERGAFTGAATSHAGVFEAAHGGTLFLDEIGEMPLMMQAKLLRVIETGDVTRLGSTELRHVDARIVAATNRDLDEEVRAGRFRQDLYYRVRVCLIQLPPLRERPEDIAPIVTHHLSLIAERERRAPQAIARGALEKLLGYSWPGNVRELVNVLERAFVLAHPGAIGEEHIMLPDDGTPAIVSYREARDDFDERYHAQLLRAAGGNISFAAKLANRTRTQIYEALRRFRIMPSSFRDDNENA